MGGTLREALDSVFLNVAIEREHQLRLRAVAFDHDREGLEAVQRVRDRRFADAAAQRLRAQRDEPVAERLRRRRKLDHRQLRRRGGRRLRGRRGRRADDEQDGCHERIGHV